MSTSYAPPLDRLLTLGEPDSRKNWLDYPAFDIASEHVPELLRMVSDEALSIASPETSEAWGPVHAWRAIGQLGATEAVGPLLERMGRVSDSNYDEWFCEDFAHIMGLIGPAAVPELADFLATQWHDRWARSYVASAIEEIAKRQPETRAECVTILTRQLDRAEENGWELNGCLIAGLVDLKAVESADVIERAFAKRLVDETMNGDWPYVKHELGLGPKPPPRRFVPMPSFGSGTLNPRQRAAVRRKKAKAQRKRVKRK